MPDLFCNNNRLFLFIFITCFRVSTNVFPVGLRPQVWFTAFFLDTSNSVPSSRRVEADFLRAGSRLKAFRLNLWLCPSEPVRCPRPCENAGVCVGLSRCRCPKGFSGTFCESGGWKRHIRGEPSALLWRWVVCSSRLQPSPRPACPRVSTAPPAALTTPAPVLRARRACAVRNCESCSSPLWFWRSAVILCGLVPPSEPVRSSPWWSAWREPSGRPSGKALWIAADLWEFSCAPNTGSGSVLQRPGPSELMLTGSGSARRINQARVYLQAYRVGYRIQCPEKTGR